MTHALYTVTTTTTTPDTFRITKFSLSYEVESSYLKGPLGCECPGFASRGRCRHSAILSEFLSASRVNSGYFLEFESAPIGWHPPLGSSELNAAEIPETKSTEPMALETPSEEGVGERLAAPQSSVAGETSLRTSLPWRRSL